MEWQDVDMTSRNAGARAVGRKGRALSFFLGEMSGVEKVTKADRSVVGGGVMCSEKGE